MKGAIETVVGFLIVGESLKKHYYALNAIDKAASAPITLAVACCAALASLEKYYPSHSLHRSLLHYQRSASERLNYYCSQRQSSRSTA